ncbi:hypothetical protein SacazDRAFT_01689 [Saccharomonospora azurea NA-128]|uniref:DUF3558 domain-containing protein n=1 Tax=Saccharomonospora azurea NA-128 TaxID=882081 RepID=H8GAS7_9PSEU|nr:hypothetical protein SacazDRAFT_01689 [Saccharomonospora azurea NA-128]
MSPVSSQRLGVLFVLALLLTSCAPTVDGVADAADVPPLTSTAALGDLDTVDFCSLLDTRRLREAGASVERTTSGFLRCDAEVEIGTAGLAVSIGDLHWATPFVQADESTKLARSVTRRHFEDEWACWQQLVFSDEVGLEIAAYQSYGDIAGDAGDAEMCTVADLVTDGVQQLVFSSGTREVMTFADGSLAELAPCSLLTMDEAADVLRVDSVLFEDAIGGGGCSWWWLGEPYAGVDLDFEVVHFGPLVSDHYDDTLGGRPTRSFVSEGQCVIDTPHMRVPAEVPTDWEVVSLYVYAETAACDKATELAELVWPRLPEYEGEG